MAGTNRVAQLLYSLDIPQHFPHAHGSCSSQHILPIIFTLLFLYILMIFTIVTSIMHLHFYFKKPPLSYIPFFLFFFFFFLNKTPPPKFYPFPLRAPLPI